MNDKMQQMSRLEINVRRLLSRCELMAKDDPDKDWRLEKYILALDGMIKNLQTLPNKPSRDLMTEYIRRIEFLKGVIDTTKLSNPIEKVAAAQLLPKSVVTMSDNIGSSITTQIHQKTTARFNKELRSELFNTDKESPDNGLRQRVIHQSSQEEDLDAIIKYNRNIQEKIAENMLLMTNNMKEHAQTASAIIRKDITSLEKSDKLTDTNVNKLKKESIKLEEHTKSTWRCWVWVMVAFVLIVFFNMVLFMKVAKKKV
ncbi:vesicle transport protein USE1 [Orussus abietinus]|uniref:vesicle transport protein USE1 n=1 Tax=Orussus abietinus TaxID=222816 RepID=UPI000625690C|nr:vesicle transport protein USE1 [Orussus abietinus]XP_012276006.1 vesicle transport protein USE1 [Orussus abietinus]XP_023289051.1 vesicle transport protein USE1 [Orussus abietinus]XP_023289052.1 vesicle transport protein USE1 [Orussus abietinus]